MTEFAQDGVFDFPHGIATTSQHDIVVSDLCQHSIVILHPDGTLRNKFGSYGEKVHQFDHPYFLAVNHNDVIFVSDNGNMSVKSFNLDGKVLQFFNMADFRLMDECFILLQGIAVDSDNHVLVIGNSSIYICAQDGRMWEVIIPMENEEDLHSPRCLAHCQKHGQIVVTQVGLDNRHEVSVFQYRSEDYHSLKCVQHLSFEARAKEHMMRKAKSLDSSGPTTTKYFPSPVNGYVAPSFVRKAASQKTKSSHKKSIQDGVKNGGPKKATKDKREAHSEPPKIVNGIETKDPDEKTGNKDQTVTKIEVTVEEYDVK